MNNILVINNELNVIDNEYVSYKDNVITFKKNCGAWWHWIYISKFHKKR